MTTTPTTIAPPLGARFVDDWQQDDPHSYRVVMGAYRTITDHKLTVFSTAVQWADGRVDDGRIEPPHVYVDDVGDNGLTSTQAREFAAALLLAADQADGWAGRPGGDPAAIDSIDDAIEVTR